jgi:glycerol-1-phosphate dehydrogenase [NAD(P)+]
MRLRFDPSGGKRFWNEISKIPGYPDNEKMPIGNMLFESDGIYRIGEVLTAAGAKKSSSLILVIDETRMVRKGKDLKAEIEEILRREGWKLDIITLKADKLGQVHTDMTQIEFTKKYLTFDCSVLSVGSGVVTDVAKHACYLFQQEANRKIPFVVFQTANSVSAFTSCLAPVFINGVKRTVNSRYPDALICDLETLADAPREMTVAGVGDMLAGFVSLPDWYLANQLGMDPGYTEFASMLLGPLDEIFLSYTEEIYNRTPEGMSILAKIIALGGLAMSLSHATTPMSGFEHVMSHVLDLQFEMKELPLPQHGSQVALATIVGLEMYQEFLKTFDPASIVLDDCYPKPEIMKKQIFDNFKTIDPSGKAAEECWSDYKQKLYSWNDCRNKFLDSLRNWTQIEKALKKQIRSTDVIMKILKAINAPIKWEMLIPEVHEEAAHFAFMNASLMRKRMTIGDLFIFMNWDRETLWKQIWMRQQNILAK